MVQTRRKNGPDMTGAHASHKAYNDKVQECLGNIVSNWTDDPSGKLKDVMAFISRLEKQIVEDVVKKGGTINGLDVKC